MTNNSLTGDSNSAKSLKGQWALITGSSSGIGQAIALEFAAAGANVIIHGCRKLQAARQLVEQIQGLGVESNLLMKDLSATAACVELVEQAWQIAPLDIWVNNAGADVLTGAAADGSFQQKLAALWSVDVLATTQLSRSVGAQMKRRGHGVLLNIGWDQAEAGMEGDSGEMFALTKGAVMALTRSLAKSLAPEVRVNCIAPGWIKTDWGSTASDYWQQRAVEESLLGRWGKPKDIAQAALFLASSQAAFITGQILKVNGGQRF